MITLIKFKPAFGLPDPSPFGIKAELLLKMSGLPYRREEVMNPRRGPKGKLPAIVDGGETIGDSELIRWHLERRHGIDFDRGLDALSRARAHAWARMLEERTYFIAVAIRWLDDANWPRMRDELFASIPRPVRVPLCALFRRKARRNAWAQGTGRHSRAEIDEMGRRDLRALALELGGKDFMMAAEPTGLDATAYAFLAGLAPFPSALRDEIHAHPNLVAYAARMKARFFG